MSGFKNTALNRLIVSNTLNFIVGKVLLCLEMMQQDCVISSIKIPNREPDICNYLFSNYLNNDAIVKTIGLDDFRFFSEVPENYVNNMPRGRADLQVFSIDEFRHRNRYFIIECKRNLTLNREYIDEGIRRFVCDNPKYTSYYKINCMLGFVIRDIDILANAAVINMLLQTDYSDIHTDAYLSVGVIPRTFISSHGLIEDSRIELLHAFSDCTEIVGNLADHKGTEMNFKSMASTVATFRDTGTVDETCLEEIRKDTKRRCGRK